MPTMAYMSINGKTQGNITKEANTATSVGGFYQSVNPDTVQVLRYESGLTVPTDPLSQQPAGQRQHMPVKVVAPISKAWPLVCQATATGESCTIEVLLYRTNAAGQQENYGNIKYTDCVIIGSEFGFSHVLMEDNKPLGHEHEITFTYAEVEWNHTSGGTSAGDNWRKPVS